MGILAIPADHPDLATALTVAVDGDEIVFDDGVFEGGFPVSPIAVDVTIRGSGPGLSTLRIGADNRGLAITGAVTFVSLTMSGADRARPIEAYGSAVVTFDDAEVIDGVASDLGGLLFVGDHAHVFGSDTLFSGGNALFGGAIALGADTAGVFSGCRFEGNHVQGGGSDGGAVRVGERAFATFEGCTFSDNTSTDHVGGALAIVNGEARAEVSGCTFERNLAAVWGGAIVLFDGNSLTVTDSTFDGNTADEGGGIACFGARSCDLTVSGTSFANGTASRGGHLFVANGVVALTDVAFSTGIVTGDGGAIHQIEGELVATDVRFEANHSDGDGGALSTDQAAVTLLRPTFCHNDATSAGGGVYVREGGVFTVTNGSFFGNTAVDDGAAIRIRDRGAEVVQSTFVGDVSSRAFGVIGVEGGEGLTVTRSVFASGGSPALYANNAAAALSWSGFWETRAFDADVVETDPVVLASDPFPDLGTTCPDVAVPVYDGPLVDVGDPAVNDPDTTVDDLGATGGPDADPELWADADSDGVVAMWDCDDADPLVALEPGCAGSTPGTTTVPTSPTTSTVPEAEPRASAENPRTAEIGCGCATSGSGGWLPVVVAWFARRRRRS